jgi:NTE family protein
MLFLSFYGGRSVHRHGRFVIVLGSMLVLCALAMAQAPATSPAAQMPTARPRVVLALSGGGSLGLAHIGVLRYCEEHHIPVDGIAGSSMGALVGALYATGHSPREIEQLMAGAEWREASRITDPYVVLPVAERVLRATSASEFELRLGTGGALPAGLSPGTAFDLFASRNLLAYSEVQDFSRLPTPFRAVATDIRTGKAITLEHGNLPRALRASIAVPGLLAPVEHDGHFLVDGGLVDNLPTDIARAMGADIVIGVYFPLPVPNPDRLRTLPNVVTQAVSVAISVNERERMSMADLLLTPSLTGLGGIDPAHTHELAERGYQAAQQKERFLSTLALNDADWAAYVAARQARLLPAPPPILRAQATAVTTNGTSADTSNASSDASLARAAERAVPSGILLTPQQLDQRLQELSAATGSSGVFYRLHPPMGDDAQASSAQSSAVLAEAEPRTGGQWRVRPAIEFATANGESARGAVTAAATYLPAGDYSSRLRLAATAGYSPGINATWEHDFAHGWFWSPALTAQRTDTEAYTGGSQQTHWQDSYSAAFDVGYASSTRWRMRIGVEAGYERPHFFAAAPAEIPGDGAFVAPRLRAEWITLDDPILPAHGALITATLAGRYRQSDGSFTPLGQLAAEEHWPVAHGVVTALLAANSNFGASAHYYDLFALGGEGDLRGYRFQQYHAASLARTELAYRRPLTGFTLFGQHPWLGAWYDAAGFALPGLSWQSEQSGSVGVLWRTPLGVLTFAVGRTADGQTRGWLRVGRP